MKHIVTTFLIITQFLCFQSFSQKSQILENMKWRNIGPDRGGRSLAVSGSSSRLNEYYFGAVGGGLWKTTDGGTTEKILSGATRVARQDLSFWLKNS